MTNPPGLGARLATAVVALPILLAIVWWAPAGAVVALVAGATLAGALELRRLLELGGARPPLGAGSIAIVLFFADPLLPASFPPLAPIALLLLLTTSVLSGVEPERGLPGTAATLLAVAYLGILGGQVAGLRVIPPEPDGRLRLLMLFAIVMTTDVSAYFAGFAFGRRPLAPHLSPKKTIEGALGGLVGGVIGASLFAATFLPALPTLHAAGLGLAAASLGEVGDLFESSVKRWAHVKDSGDIFPGHGGMLDRLDGLLFGAPVLYYYFLYAA